MKTKNHKVKYTRDMYKTMCKTFFGSKAKGLDVEACADITAGKLIKKYPNSFDTISPAGVRAKCYQLQREGYNYKTDTFADQDVEQVKKMKQKDTKAKDEKFRNAEDVKVVGYHKEERKVISDVISMTVRGVEITMVFK